ncbi:MAG: ATP-binding protein [Clostridia bacterium]|jgi:DNA replication protein DnaC|nr:ATP-binding protein [Clostridia bacterium]MDD4571604.1 ATP-binding protein [Clostridia bacterium]
MENINNFKFNIPAQVNKNIIDAEYDCPLCHDTGILLNDKNEAMPCKCRISRRLKEKQQKANLAPALLKMKLTNFDNSYYSVKRKYENGVNYFKLANDAHEAAVLFAMACNSQYLPNKGLAFFGDVGSGKTHLAAGIANELVQKNVDVLFLVVPDFLDSLKATYNQNGEFSEDQLMDRAKKTNVLILDDLGNHTYTEWTQSKLFSLINYRLNEELPTVFTTNFSIEDLREAVGIRIVSRIIGASDIYMLKTEEDIRYIKGKPKSKK